MDELEMMEKPRWKNRRIRNHQCSGSGSGCIICRDFVVPGEEAGEDAAEKAEEEPAVEKVTAEEIIGEPEEVVAEETVDTAGDVLEEGLRERLRQ